MLHLDCWSTTAFSFGLATGLWHPASNHKDEYYHPVVLHLNLYMDFVTILLNFTNGLLCVLDIHSVRTVIFPNSQPQLNFNHNIKCFPGFNSDYSVVFSHTNSKNRRNVGENHFDVLFWLCTCLDIKFHIHWGVFWWVLFKSLKYVLF